jgi:Retroviral aspartyl protease/Ty3 transposon capsid-like protein
MTRTTKNSSSTSDEVHHTSSDLEERVDGISTVMQKLSTRMTTTDSQVEQLNSQVDQIHSQFTQFATQHAHVPEMLQLLLDKMDKNHSPQLTASPTATLTPSRIEKTVPVQNSAPYRHPHAFPSDNFKQHSHPEPPRRDDDWCHTDSTLRWVPPRAELTKFDGTNLIDWLDDYEYYFCTSHTPEFYKIQMVIPSLTGEAREWHRYYKLSNPDPSWPQFVAELQDRFNANLKNPVDEFKKIQQDKRVDDYINSFERIKARITARQFSDEEYYLLGFLSGLKDEIADAVILYNPTTLKQAYKLARQIEKALDSQSRMIKPAAKSFSSTVLPSRSFLPKNDKPLPVTNDVIKTPSPAPNNSLSLDQKRTLGLCFRCGDKYFTGYKCKTKVLHVLEEEEFQEPIDCSLFDSLTENSGAITQDDPSIITMCTSQLLSKHKTLKFKGQIGSIDVLAMLDSGSTHSFIHPSIVQALKLPTVSSTPLTVITASGAKLTTSLLCSQLSFQLQSHTFQADFMVLQVTNHDVILGMDWLNAHSPLTYDGYNGTLSLTLLNQTVLLYCHPITAELTFCDASLNLLKEIQQGNTVLIAHLFSTTVQEPLVQQDIPFQIQEILSQFSAVFAEPTSLLPSRSCDHQINLIPN